MKCRRAAFKETEILSIANNAVIQERNLQDIAGQTGSPSQIATALESMVVFATGDARLSASSHKSFSKRIATAPKNKLLYVAQTSAAMSSSRRATPHLGLLGAAVGGIRPSCRIMLMSSRVA